MNLGCSNLVDFEDKIVAWNIETEARFCSLDSKRMMILGYRAIYDEVELKSDTAKWSEDRLTVGAHVRRWKFVMKFLGDQEDAKFEPKFPRTSDPIVTTPSDYTFLRAG